MMSTVHTGWLKDNNGEKFAPKTLSSQVMTKDGISIDTLLNELSIDGGVSSWNDLEDKPFYEECSELSNTITWDGDTTGKEFVDMSGDGSMIMYKVSNVLDTITLDDFADGLISSVSIEGNLDIPLMTDMVYDASIDGLPFFMIETEVSSTLIALDDFSLFGISFTKGVWFSKIPEIEAYVSVLQITKPSFGLITINYLDSKYIKDMYRTEDMYKVLIETEFDGMSLETQEYLPLEVSKEYSVIWNGEEYKQTALLDDIVTGADAIYLGNRSIFYNNPVLDTGEPFVIISVLSDTGYGIAVKGNELINSSHTEFSVVKTSEIHKVPEKYIPDSIARVEYVNSKTGVGKDVSGKEFTINNNTVTAADRAEIFNDYENNQATGEYSHAEGSNTKATGDWSHAEGYGTVASRDCSHAEGNETTASGKYSHAEGECTIASGYCQHVEGRYNIEKSGNEYAHIVGNGSSRYNRSNAYTLDWNGNAVYAGDVFVCDNLQEGGYRLATEEYVDAFMTQIEDIQEITDEEIINLFSEE